MTTTMMVSDLFCDFEQGTTEWDVSPDFVFESAIELPADVECIAGNERATRDCPGGPWYDSFEVEFWDVDADGRARPFSSKRDLSDEDGGDNGVKLTPEQLATLRAECLAAWNALPAERRVRGKCPTRVVPTFPQDFYGEPTADDYVDEDRYRYQD